MIGFVLPCEYKPVVSASYANEFIGDFGLGFGVVCTVGYVFGGVFTDMFSEKILLIAGGVLMGLCSFWFGTVPSATSWPGDP